MPDTPHSRFRHLYAIVRIDLPVDGENPENNISVVKAFASKLAAAREVTRLNNLNSGKGCRYALHVTRLWSSPN